MKARFVNEEFKENSDPIRDMGIGVKFPKNEDFKPMYILIKKFPGCVCPINTVYGSMRNGTSLAAFHPKMSDGHILYCTAWDEKEYFIPYVGEFFQKI